jgi:hypothetical protein
MDNKILLLPTEGYMVIISSLLKKHKKILKGYLQKCANGGKVCLTVGKQQLTRRC